MSSLPPLPPGFTLDPPPQAADMPPLPAGFTLDAPSARGPRVYDPFSNDESALPPFPGEEVIEHKSEAPAKPGYLEGIRQAFAAPGRTDNPQNIGERIGNVPLLGPLYGLAEAGATLLTGAAALPLASAKGIIEGREPTSEDIAQLTYEPRSQIGRAALGLAGAVAQPVVDAAEATGADVALLPLAAETQALGTVARGRKELKQTKAEGERLMTPPTREELATAAKEAYDQARAAGAVAAPESYARMASGLRESLRQEGFNKRLHPKAAAVVAEIEKTVGKPVALDELEILRRQALAAERSIEADERRIAGLIIDRLDDYADALASGAEPIVGGNAKVAVAARNQARNLYSRNRKAQEIQELVERAEVRASQFSGSGLENALRTEFRQLALNPKRMRRFTKEEQAAIKEVAFGTPTRNTLRQIGKLAPTGGLMQSLSLLGAVLEPTTLVAPAIGGAARFGATKLTQRAASRAEELMRRGNPSTADELGAALRESGMVRPSALEGELMSREPLALPAPNMVAGQRSAPGTAFAREEVGLTPDVERAGALHPSAPRQTERAAPALPLLPPRDAPPIVVDAQGRAALAPELAAYLDEIGLAQVRGVRQPRAEPDATQNLFAQLSRVEEADRAGAAFDAERAAAAAASAIDVQEHPRSAVKEITLEAPPENSVASLAPKGRSPTESIRALVRRVTERPSDSTTAVVEYENVVHPAAVEAFKEAGIDVSGYTHVIDNSAIRHILKSHGDPKKERARGQLPITEDDIARLPEIVLNPDFVESGGLTNRGRDAIVYAKRLEDGRILIVEEARTRKGQLAVASMWKVARQEQMPSVKTQSSAPTSQTSGGAPSKRDPTTFAELIELSGDRVRSRRAPIEHISTNAFEQLRGR